MVVRGIPYSFIPISQCFVRKGRVNHTHRTQQGGTRDIKSRYRDGVIAPFANMANVSLTQAQVGLRGTSLIHETRH